MKIVDTWQAKMDFQPLDEYFTFYLHFVKDKSKIQSLIQLFFHRLYVSFSLFNVINFFIIYFIHILFKKLNI